MGRALLPRGREEDAVIIRIRSVSLELPVRYIPHYVRADYEPLTTRAFLERSCSGATVVDVGAHIGYFTCLAARAVGPAGTVHAVEPAPENLKFLKANIERNALANVMIHPVAAASEEGLRRLCLTTASDSHGFFPHPQAKTVATIEVGTTALATLVPGRADVIKIDVEGAEFEVLHGLRPLLRRSVGATVIVEWNPGCLRAAGQDPVSLPRYLSEVGIEDLFVIDDLRGCHLSVSEQERIFKSRGMSDSRYVNLVGVASNHGNGASNETSARGPFSYQPPLARP